MVRNPFKGLFSRKKSKDDNDKDKVSQSADDILAGLLAEQDKIKEQAAAAKKKKEEEKNTLTKIKDSLKELNISVSEWDDERIKQIEKNRKFAQNAQIKVADSQLPSINRKLANVQEKIQELKEINDSLQKIKHFSANNIENLIKKI